MPSRALSRPGFVDQPRTAPDEPFIRTRTNSRLTHSTQVTAKGSLMTIAGSADFEKPLFAQWLGTAHPASEQMYFLNMPLAHVVAYEDHQRETRLARAIALSQRSIRPRMLA